MKLSETMAFPHPVLRPGAQDWVRGSIDCELSIEEAPEVGVVQLSGRIMLDQPALHDLIRSGQLGCGIFLTCLDTSFSLMYETGLDAWQHELAPGSVSGCVTVRPVVFARGGRVDLPGPDLHPEFGREARTVAPYQIVGFGAELRFEAGLEKLLPMESIFKIVPDERIEEARFQLGTESQAVEIRVSNRLYEEIGRLRNNSLAREVLVTSLYLPCIMKLLAHAAGESREELRWYRALRANCRHHGFELEGADPVLICEKAQLLLDYPLGRLYSTVEAFAK